MKTRTLHIIVYSFLIINCIGLFIFSVVQKIEADKWRTEAIIQRDIAQEAIKLSHLNQNKFYFEKDIIRQKKEIEELKKINEENLMLIHKLEMHLKVSKK